MYLLGQARNFDSLKILFADPFDFMFERIMIGRHWGYSVLQNHGKKLVIL